MRMTPVNDQGNRTAGVLGVVGAMIFGLFVWVLTAGPPGEPMIPTPTVSDVTVSASGQSGAWARFPQACRYHGEPISPDCLDGYSLQEREAMACENEDQGQDGTPDQAPCLWVDPSTGDLWYMPAE